MRCQAKFWFNLKIVSSKLLKPNKIRIKVILRHIFEQNLVRLLTHLKLVLKSELHIEDS